MSLQINIKTGQKMDATGSGFGWLHPGGNPWTLPDALAIQAVDRGFADPVDWPSTVRAQWTDLGEQEQAVARGLLPLRARLGDLASRAGILALPQQAVAPFPKLGDVLALRAAILPGFGSSAADSTVSATGTSSMYYDTVLGSESNSGTNAFAPKKIVPQYITTANRKVYISNTSTINAVPTPTVAGVTITVYDGETGSSTFGQEIVDQPNPFIRALLGGWVTEIEKRKKYFKVLRTDLNLASSPLTTAQFLHNSPGAGACLVRGAWFAGGAPNAVYVDQPANTLRLEDSVIDHEVIMDPRLRADKQSCRGVRIGNNPPTAKCTFARVFFGTVGEDQFYSFGTVDSNAPIIVDSAFNHTGPGQRYRSQHADCLQFGPNPGGFVVRRTVFQHILGSAIEIVDDGSGKTNPVGTIFISSGDPATGSGGLFEDCVLMSNNQIANVEFQSGVTFNRCIGMLLSASIPQNAMLNFFGSGPAVETDCIWAVLDPSQGGSVRYGAGGSTRTRVTELLY